MNSYSGVEVLTLETDIVTNLCVMDVASRKEELLHSELIGALNDLVEISTVALLSVVLACEALVR